MTPDSGLIDELKDKKERIKRKLMVEESDQEEVIIPSYLKEKRKVISSISLKIKFQGCNILKIDNKFFLSLEEFNM